MEKRIKKVMAGACFVPVGYSEIRSRTIRDRRRWRRIWAWDGNEVVDGDVLVNCEGSKLSVTQPWAELGLCSEQFASIQKR
jgi:hypothetical protein